MSGRISTDARPPVGRMPTVPVTLHLTHSQLETAIRQGSKSPPVMHRALLKKLIVARDQADYLRSLERATRLKNWS